ncbi:MAG: ASKHA domain-containing protein [Actinomycetota bacterium]|nr:ASKHA domain-containing protein [Actinomycetota bacterium]
MPRVTFIPEDVFVDVQTGENLLRTAMMADVGVTATCGGDGTCGKCRMIVEQGDVEAIPSSRLTDDQVAAGYVLGCTTQVVGDIVVRIPAESRPGAAPARAHSQRTLAPLLTIEEQAARVPLDKSIPPVLRRYVELPRPDLCDNADSVSRLRQALRREHRVRDATFTLEAMREIPGVVAEAEWNVTALVVDPIGGAPAITRVEPGDTTDQQYAIAVDVGTTSVEVALVDLNENVIVAQCSEYNRQVKLGSDVITRVIAGSTLAGLVELQHLVADTITDLVLQVCAEADVSVPDLNAYFVAGNTVMTHLLYGISPASIRFEPYVPVASEFPLTTARKLGLPGGPATQVISMPCPASWLGGDIVAGVLAAGIPWADRLTLFVDIGTNGEIVLANTDWLIACSCSAGPAFEGAGIQHGMRAAEGAIEQVRIESTTLEPAILTIGNVKPLGICGSGLIDCVAELFLAGALERNGHLAPHTASSERVRSGERGMEYVLVHAEDSGTGSDIVLTETDIESLMRAKAAIHAGISVLAECVDIDITQVEEVIVAGGFGHYLDLERVMALGMLPELPLDRFTFIGNSSLLGATHAAKSSEMLKTAHKIAEMMTYVELSVSAGFMDHYMSSLFLPHTDLARFPRAQQLIDQRVVIEEAS